MILDRLQLKPRSRFAQVLFDIKAKIVSFWQFAWKRHAFIGKDFNDDRHLHFQGILGVPVLVFEEQTPKCIYCGKCEAVCPTDCFNIRSSLGSTPKSFEIDLSKCVSCGLCIEVCPEEALVSYNSFRFHYDKASVEKGKLSINIEDMKSLH